MSLCSQPVLRPLDLVEEEEEGCRSETVGLRQVTYFQASFLFMGDVRNRSMSSNCSVLVKPLYFGSVWKMLLRSGPSAKGYTHTCKRAEPKGCTNQKDQAKDLSSFPVQGGEARGKGAHPGNLH